MPPNSPSSCSALWEIFNRWMRLEWAAANVPEGHLTIARRFNAGSRAKMRSCVPEGRLKLQKMSRVSTVPTARNWNICGVLPASELAGYYRRSLRDRVLVVNPSIKRKTRNLPLISNPSC
jgi:hypothetical protein